MACPSVPWSPSQAARLAENTWPPCCGLGSTYYLPALSTQQQQGAVRGQAALILKACAQLHIAEALSDNGLNRFFLLGHQESWREAPQGSLHISQWCLQCGDSRGCSKLAAVAPMTHHVPCKVRANLLKELSESRTSWPALSYIASPPQRKSECSWENGALTTYIDIVVSRERRKDSPAFFLYYPHGHPPQLHLSVRQPEELRCRRRLHYTNCPRY